MTDVADVADIPEGEEEETVAPKRGGRLKLIIIIAAALIVALGAGAALYLFVLSGPAEVATDGSTPAPVAEAEVFFYDLPPMTVNLSSPETDPQFLKLEVSLELANQEMRSVIAPRMARVMDAFQVYLRELRRTDLEGSAGVYRLKEELRRRVNLAVYPAVVDNILFKEILVQ